MIINKPGKNSMKKDISFEESVQILQNCLNCAHCHAFDDFLEQYDLLIKDVINRVFTRLQIKDRDEILKDAYQEFCEEIIKKEKKVLAVFDPDRNTKISTYLFQIAMFSTIDFLKKQKKVRINEALCDKIFDFIKINRNLIQTIDEELIEKHFMKCLERLPTTEKLVFKLSFVENKSDDDIQAILSKTKSSIHTAKHRATEKMKECMRNTLELLFHVQI
jgi:RNA polymerase sigma factor (sigma-70 family)